MLDVAAPPWPSRLNIWFVMHDGQAAQLIRDLPLAAGERRSLSETDPSFPWIVDAPFGLELVVMTVSEGPLFPAPRPDEEAVDALAGALRGALAAPGRRLAARAIMVETRER